MFKKLSVFIVILVIIFSSLFGCNKTGNKNPETNPDETRSETVSNQDSEVDLSFLEPEAKLITGWGVISEAAQNGFVRDNPDYDLQIEDCLPHFPFAPDSTVDLIQLAGAIKVGEQPDLVIFNMSPCEAYYSNLFIPIDKYVKNDPDFNIKDMDPNLFDVYTFNDLIYFMPNTYTAGLLVWNKNLFEQVGLDPDKPPETWDEFKEMNSRLVTHDSTGKLTSVGVVPDLNLVNSFSWDLWNLASFGQDGHRTDKTRLVNRWNTDYYRQTFEYIRDLTLPYGGMENIPTENFSFVTGNVGFITWNGAVLGGLAALVQFDIGISDLPTYDKDSPHYSSGVINASYGIPVGAKNPAGAWKFVSYKLTDGYIEESRANYDSNPKAFIPIYNFHKPTREKIYEIFESLMDEKNIAMMKERDRIESERNVAMYTTPKEGKIRESFNELYKKMIISEITVQDFLINLQNISDQVIKEFLEEKKEEGWVFEEGKESIPPVRTEE